MLQLPFDVIPEGETNTENNRKTNKIICISGITPDMNHRNKLIISTNQFAPSRNSVRNDPQTPMINKKRIGKSSH